MPGPSVRSKIMVHFFGLSQNFFNWSKRWHLINRTWCISTTPNTTEIFFDNFQTYTANYYGHSELSRGEKTKLEFEEKKFSLLLKREVCRHFCLENATLGIVKPWQVPVFEVSKTLWWDLIISESLKGVNEQLLKKNEQKMLLLLLLVCNTSCGVFKGGIQS